MTGVAWRVGHPGAEPWAGSASAAHYSITVALGAVISAFLAAYEKPLRGLNAP